MRLVADWLLSFVGMDMLRCWFRMEVHALLVIFIVHRSSSTKPHAPVPAPDIMNEICQFETFDVSCGQHEVIVMESARFGRMETGRCVLTSYGVEGCVVELRTHLDRMCSGRQQCKVPVPDETMRRMNDCPPDLASFLQASYHCRPVEAVAADSCFAGGELVIRSKSGYLSSEHAQRSGQGSADCPWVINVEPGQRINITLLDFHTLDGGTLENEINFKPRHSSYCQKYATIREQHTTRKNTVCGEGEREKVVYLSATNKVHVEIDKYNVPKKTPFFLLKFEAVGCPLLHAPTNGWLEQTSKDATVGCNHSQHTWHLQCDRNRWVGTYHNCTTLQEPSTIWAVFSDEWSSPVGILIVSGLGVALGLVIGMAMLSVVLLLMKKNRSTCCIGDPIYEETRQDSDEHNAVYEIENKHNSNAVLVDQMELVSMPETYGAMWRSRPPSYTPPTESSDTQTTRISYNMGSTSSRSSELLTPRITRIPEVHLYESPKPSRREFMVADLSDRDVS